MVEGVVVRGCCWAASLAMAKTPNTAESGEFEAVIDGGDLELPGDLFEMAHITLFRKTMG